MGGRRKGEISPARLDREWPHQVMLPGSRVIGRVQGEEIEAFCRGRSAAPRHHAEVIGDIWHIVHCFAVPEDATAFAKRFGGVPFDPAKRGRGRHWLLATQPRGDGERPYYRRALFAPHADAAPIAVV